MPFMTPAPEDKGCWTENIAALFINPGFINPGFATAFTKKP